MDADMLPNGNLGVAGSSQTVTRHHLAVAFFDARLRRMATGIHVESGHHGYGTLARFDAQGNFVVAGSIRGTVQRLFTGAFRMNGSRIWRKVSSENGQRTPIALFYDPLGTWYVVVSELSGGNSASVQSVRRIDSQGDDVWTTTAPEVAEGLHAARGLDGTIAVVGFKDTTRKLTISTLIGPATLRAAATTVRGGGVLRLTVQLQDRAPSGGQRVALALNPHFTMPRSVVVPAGQKTVSATISAKATAVPIDTTLSLVHGRCVSSVSVRIVP
jgi:hypothetical protein